MKFPHLLLALFLALACEASPSATSDTAPDSAPDAVTDTVTVTDAATDTVSVSDAAPETAADVAPGCEDFAPAIHIQEGNEVGPQATLHLSTIPSYEDCDAFQVEWSVEQPIGSQSVFLPSPTYPSPVFEANVAGTYTFHATMCCEIDGVSCCATAEQQLAVTCWPALQVELTWRTPGDPDETDTGAYAGSDLNLHLIHPNAPTDPSAPDGDGDGEPDPYYDPLYDCYWFNPSPDWTRFRYGLDAMYNPRLDRDDTDGAGPENINLTRGEVDARYRVAVYYWDDHGYGPAWATVRIYSDGRLLWEAAEQRLNPQDLWCVAFVNGTDWSVEACEDDEGAPVITPDYAPAPFAVGK